MGQPSTELDGGHLHRKCGAASVRLTPAQPRRTIAAMGRRKRVTMRGWAVWAATLVVVLLLNGIVWTLVVAY